MSNTDGNAAPIKDTTTTVVLLVVAAAGAIVSWAGWFFLARWSGWAWALALLVPIVVDVYAYGAARAWLTNPHLSTSTKGYAGFSALCAIAVSVIANLEYHIVQDVKGHPVPEWIVAGLGVLVPIMVAQVAILHALISKDHKLASAAAAKAAEQPERPPAKTVQARPRPAVQARPETSVTPGRAHAVVQGQGRVPQPRPASDQKLSRLDEAVRILAADRAAGRELTRAAALEELLGVKERQARNLRGDALAIIAADPEGGNGILRHLNAGGTVAAIRTGNPPAIAAPPPTGNAAPQPGNQTGAERE